MRFIKFTFRNNNTLGLWLDDIILIESFNETDIVVHSRVKDAFTFAVGEDEFYTKVYSDDVEKDYNLIDICESEPLAPIDVTASIDDAIGNHSPSP